MLKENKQFWLYIAGTIILFVILIFVIRSYVGSSSLPGLFDPVGVTPVTTIAYQEQPEEKLNTDLDYTATIKTNKGEFKIDLFEKNAPNTVSNFVYLATDDFYDGVKFHRLIPNLLLQGGSRNTLNADPADDAFGGPGYVINDEINWDSLDFKKPLRDELTKEGYKSVSVLKSVDVAKYRIAMANSGPNTNGSQFFIILADEQDNAEVVKLRGRFTVFAEVVDNLELIDQLAQIQVDSPESQSPRPLDDIVIQDIEIRSFE